MGGGETWVKPNYVDNIGVYANLSVFGIIYGL